MFYTLNKSIKLDRLRDNCEKKLAKKKIDFFVLIHICTTTYLGIAISLEAAQMVIAASISHMANFTKAKPVLDGSKVRKPTPKSLLANARNCSTNRNEDLDSGQVQVSQTTFDFAGHSNVKVGP